MGLENIANEDMTVAFSNSAGPPDITYSTDPGIDTTSVVPTKSTKCKIDDKSICTTSVTINWSTATPCPHTSETHTFVSGVAVIMPSATKTKADGALVLRAKDTSELGCMGSWTAPDGKTPVPCACSVEISDAGQDKVKAQ